MTEPEPWLRGPLPDINPIIGHLLRSSQQIREDIAKANLTAPRAGFHAKHLAGSTRRLCAYLAGRALTPDEIAAIPQENTIAETPAQLIAAVHTALDHYEQMIRELPPEDFATLRHVGRSRIPVTAIGLAIHIAEHGQRHVGQAIEAGRCRSDE
jgi:hypothetical protein